MNNANLATLYIQVFGINPSLQERVFADGNIITNCPYDIMEHYVRPTPTTQRIVDMIYAQRMSEPQFFQHVANDLKSRMDKAPEIARFIGVTPSNLDALLLAIMLDKIDDLKDHVKDRIGQKEQSRIYTPYELALLHTEAHDIYIRSLIKSKGT